MTNEDKNINLLQNLIWENFFRHEGNQPEVWKNKHCTRLSEIMMQKKADGPPTSKTLYNFSKKNKASAYTLSFLVEAIYDDNEEFIVFWKEKYLRSY